MLVTAICTIDLPRRGLVTHLRRVRSPPTGSPLVTGIGWRLLLIIKKHNYKMGDDLGNPRLHV